MTATTVQYGVGIQRQSLELVLGYLSLVTLVLDGAWRERDGERRREKEDRERNTEEGWREKDVLYCYAWVVGDGSLALQS